MSRQAHGLRAWLVQRVTAVYLGLFVLYVLFHFMGSAPTSYADWKGWLADPVVGMLWSLAVVSLLLHAWVGVRDVFIDYIKPAALRVSLVAVLAFSLIAFGAWAARVLFVVVNS